MDATERQVTMQFLSFVFEKWRKLLTFIVIIVIIAALLFFPRKHDDTNTSIVSEQLQSPKKNEVKTEIEEMNGDATPQTQTIIVDVRGAVKLPGVYPLNEGDRIIDAINAAGGYLPNADTKLINHAMKVSDELLIYVLAEGEEALNTSLMIASPTESSAANDRVDINIADEQELMTLPGIGPSKATSIIQYRTEKGLFKTPEDLMNVSGIGEKTYEKLESLIQTK